MRGQHTEKDIPEMTLFEIEPLVMPPEPTAAGRRSAEIREFDVDIDPEWLLPVPHTSATFADRVFAKVDASGDCWEWTAAAQDGYGVVGRGGRSAGTMQAHRAVWELLVGPIDEGLQLDHLCRNHACCNPDHLEPVTDEVNKRRGFGPAVLHSLRNTCKYGHPKDGVTLLKSGKSHRYCKTCARIKANSRRVKKGPRAPVTHCPQNHEYTPANTYIDPKGGRQCKACRSDRQQAARESARQKREAALWETFHQRTSCSRQQKPPHSGALIRKPSPAGLRRAS
jgi:hypothetical protein